MMLYQHSKRSIKRNSRPKLLRKLSSHPSNKNNNEKSLLLLGIVATGVATYSTDESMKSFANNKIRLDGKESFSTVVDGNDDLKKDWDEFAFQSLNFRDDDDDDDDDDDEDDDDDNDDDGGGDDEYDD